MFVGKYICKIDEKRRVYLPAKWKENLAGNNIFIMKWTNSALAIMTEQMYLEKIESIRNGDFSQKDKDDFIRITGASCDDISIDQQGRILVSQGLADYAGLEKEVVLVGSVDVIELWDKDNWNKFEQNTNIDTLFSHIGR